MPAPRAAAPRPRAPSTALRGRPTRPRACNPPPHTRGFDPPGARSPPPRPERRRRHRTTTRLAARACGERRARYAGVPDRIREIRSACFVPAPARRAAHASHLHACASCSERRPYRSPTAGPCTLRGRRDRTVPARAPGQCPTMRALRREPVRGEHAADAGRVPAGPGSRRLRLGSAAAPRPSPMGPRSVSDRRRCRPGSRRGPSRGAHARPAASPPRGRCAPGRTRRRRAP